VASQPAGADICAWYLRFYLAWLKSLAPEDEDATENCPCLPVCASIAQLRHS
jgi:hypothetical protein